MLGPRVAEAGFTETVSTWDGDGTDKHIPAQQTQEGLLTQQADGRGHDLENTGPGRV